MKPDIENRNDIDFLVKRFYEKAFRDNLIGPVFHKLLPDLEAHLPVIGDFWESVLFPVNKYNGNPIAIHQRVNEKIKLKKGHFERWLTLWKETADELYNGPVAENAKTRAMSIATVMQVKLR